MVPLIWLWVIQWSCKTLNGLVDNCRLGTPNLLSCIMKMLLISQNRNHCIDCIIPSVQQNTADSSYLQHLGTSVYSRTSLIWTNWGMRLSILTKVQITKTIKKGKVWLNSLYKQIVFLLCLIKYRLTIGNLLTSYFTHPASSDADDMVCFVQLSSIWW